MARFKSAGWIWASLVVLGGCGGGRDADPPVAASASASASASTPGGSASGAAGAASGASATPAPPAGGAASPPTSVATPYGSAQSVAGSFELVGGYRLQSDFASEGLALVKDAGGYVVEAIGGANSHTGKLNVYDLRSASGVGADANAYPILQPLRQWSIATLFPNEMARQNVRDYAVRKTGSGYELASIGRVYYNTAPRTYTQIDVRELSAGGTVLGPTREVAVDLPEQEFSGFIKHDDAALDFSEIGAGAYDSGQGSVGGLSYATQQTGGLWKRVLTPPGFGDLTTPRLPRDADYSCTGGSSWVCIEPAGGKGVWSTERIGGGGVMYGDNLLFIPTLGYGERNYGKQSYTFGDGGNDRAVAYFFKRDAATGQVAFQRYDPWVHSKPGELVIGVALGRLRGSTDLHLFVVKSYAWKTGLYTDGSVLQVFRIKPS